MMALGFAPRFYLIPSQLTFGVRRSTGFLIRESGPLPNQNHMPDEIPRIEDNPKAACESFIRELETYYYPWYDSAVTRNYYTWFVAQAIALLSGFATAIVAALLGQEGLVPWGFGHLLVITLPILGSLASTFLVQSRIAEMEALRERGRQGIQEIMNGARVEFAAADSPLRYTTIHRDLVERVKLVELEQSRGVERIVPKALSFLSHSAGVPE